MDFDRLATEIIICAVIGFIIVAASSACCTCDAQPDDSDRGTTLEYPAEYGDDVIICIGDHKFDSPPVEPVIPDVNSFFPAGTVLEPTIIGHK